MEKVNLNNQMDLGTMETGNKIKCMGKVYTNGLVVIFMMDNGKTISCMVMVSIQTKKIKNMKDNSLMIKEQEWVHLLGPKAKYTKASLKTISCMVLALKFLKMELRKWDNGRMANYNFGFKM